MPTDLPITQTPDPLRAALSWAVAATVTAALLVCAWHLALTAAAFDDLLPAVLCTFMAPVPLDFTRAFLRHRRR